ncbi:hypothetical protein BLS_000050, partial [Venturia inaequalis]
NFNKVDFIFALTSIRRAAFTPHNIKQGFKKAGIVPFNPERVLEFVRANQITNNTSPEERVPPNIFKYLTGEKETPNPPFTPKRALKAATEIWYPIEKLLTPRIKRLFHEFIGNLVQTSKRARILEYQYYTFEAAKQARKKQQQQSKQSTGEMGVIYTLEARKIIRKDTGDEASKLEAKAKKILAAKAYQKRETVRARLAAKATAAALKMAQKEAKKVVKQEPQSKVIIIE